MSWRVTVNAYGTRFSEDNLYSTEEAAEHAFEYAVTVYNPAYKISYIGPDGEVIDSVRGNGHQRPGQPGRGV